MIKASELMTSIRQAYAEKWGYIWGTRGQVWTQKNQDAATRNMTVRYGQKWVGRRVADCSGVPSVYLPDEYPAGWEVVA